MYIILQFYILNLVIFSLPLGEGRFDLKIYFRKLYKNMYYSENIISPQYRWGESYFPDVIINCAYPLELEPASYIDPDQQDLCSFLSLETVIEVSMLGLDYWGVDKWMLRPDNGYEDSLLRGDEWIARWSMPTFQTRSRQSSAYARFGILSFRSCCHVATLSV